jgi:hypothetical protein
MHLSLRKIQFFLISSMHHVGEQHGVYRLEVGLVRKSVINFSCLFSFLLNETLTHGSWTLLDEMCSSGTRGVRLYAPYESLTMKIACRMNALLSLATAPSASSSSPSRRILDVDLTEIIHCSCTRFRAYSRRMTRQSSCFPSWTTRYYKLRKRHIASNSRSNQTVTSATGRSPSAADGISNGG